MRAVASACGSATVVNAIATGKGAAFAVDLRVRAEVELTAQAGRIRGQILDEPSEDPRLIEICARKVLEHLGLERTLGAVVRTSSEVPIAVGLSSSSAAANATVLATFAAAGRRPKPKTAINLGVDAALEAGVTITGAFDDAAASFLGGGVVTDNYGRRVLRRFELDPRLRVIIHVPPAKLHTADVDRSRVEPLAKLVELAHRLAMSGDVMRALTLNGLLYSCALGHDHGTALEALRAGALAAGLTGTGPAVVAIAKPSDAERVMEAWRGRPGKVIVTKPSSEGARIEVKP